MSIITTPTYLGHLSSGRSTQTAKSNKCRSKSTKTSPCDWLVGLHITLFDCYCNIDALMCKTHFNFAEGWGEATEVLRL